MDYHEANESQTQQDSTTVTDVNANEQKHCRGPLDGSPYAKVNKYKKLNDVDTNHVTKLSISSPIIKPTNERIEIEKSPTNETLENHLLTNQSSTNSDVFVLDGNKIFYRKTSDIDIKPFVSAPLATLPEFTESFLSTTTSRESVSSLVNCPRHSVTSSKGVDQNPQTFESKLDSGNMDGTLQQTAAKIVDDVIQKSAVTKLHNDVTRMRYSEISSCSATTLSSTTTEDGEVHEELSENGTSSDCESLDEQFQALEGNLSPLSVREITSPETLVDETLENIGQNETLSETQFEIDEKEDFDKIEDISLELSLGKPPPLPPVVVNKEQQSRGDMHNGGIVQGKYEKGPDYAVPMRDMKITTIPSKRAVLVSNDSEEFAGSENNMTTQAERRDSVYDEGNSYSGAGYATIEEYNNIQHTGSRLTPTDESFIPADVQELLNGLQEGPTISDIDSGFHGSSMALPRDRSTSEHYNMRSQSSGEFSEQFSPQSLHSNEQSPSNEMSPNNVASSNGRLPSDKPSPSNNQYAQIAVPTSPVVKYSSQGSGPGEMVQSQQQVALPPKKKKLPGVTMATQTFPEPQEAQIQIITMKNVYNYEQPHTSEPANHESEPHALQKTANTGIGYNSSSEQKPVRVEHVAKQPSDISMATVAKKIDNVPTSQPEASMATVTMKPNNIEPEPVTMRHNNATMSLLYGDIDDELDSDNMRNVEEQIKHTQKHLEFLQQQQEKLKQRKQDRSRHRESLKRNSSAFEPQVDAYAYSPRVSSTLPRQPPKQTYNAAAAEVLQPVPKNMPPITSVNQSTMGVAPAQQSQSQNPWQPNGRVLTRHASDSGHNMNGPLKSPVAPPTRKAEPLDNDDIIMSSDLQEQLAELDRCIAQLTTSMDVPMVPDDAPAESQVVRRRKSFTLEIERKMDPNTPEENSSVPVVPRPPARSRSSFDSYKRLSQEFDVVIKGKGEQDGNDDVFSPGPQIPRKKKQSQFPPQTSVTRRQNTAPPPPPKHRISLEERLSPGLMQALSMNPGAKPKEDIHSYKEDLAPDELPNTPTFPLTPPTPYVNNESPVRSKSPPGLMKTPLSMLHLKPTDKPTEGLHHTEIDQVKVQEAPVQPAYVTGVRQDVPQNGVHQDNKGPSFEAVTAVAAMQNGHAKETDLLNDDQTPQTNVNNHPQQINATQTQLSNGQSHIGYIPQNDRNNDNGGHAAKIIPLKQDIQPSTSPMHLNLQQSNMPQVNLHGNQQPHIIEQQHPTTPQQYQLNHSGASHSSHSPAATSSNSRHGSSDSLDGPSTRHSNSSLLSSSSSSSAAHHGMPMPSPGAFMSPNTVMRPGSQMSNYDRNIHIPGGTRSGDESFGSPNSGRTSSSSISDAERMNTDMQQHPTVSAAPKFIRDTTAYWYKPDITREQALAILRNKQAGSFVVRDSRCFPGAFGLALKVDKLPPNIHTKPGADLANEYVRHFLIEPSSRGVKLKGCPNEPVFGSLSALVYQHSITPLALPCKLIIPTTDQVLPTTPQSGNTPRNSQAGPEPTTPSPVNSAAEMLKLGAACNVVYIGSVDTESLTGPLAIERAVRETYETASKDPNMTSVVHFKVSPQGITLTDNARKLFFRRHYPTSTVTFCGLDPQGSGNKGSQKRRWDATTMRGSPDAWIFGFVARKQAGSRDNTCHVFAELDSAQPAKAIVNFVMKILIGSNRQNST